MADFEEIYSTYFRDVFLYLYSLSGDRHIAEDITSETFLKAIESIDSFRGSCDLRVWLCQIAKNGYFSYLRKNKRLVHMEGLPEKAADDDLEQAITLSEASMEVHEILHSLGEPYKEVFSLSHGDGGFDSPPFVGKGAGRRGQPISFPRCRPRQDFKPPMFNIII